jgi:hypothetical protein
MKREVEVILNTETQPLYEKFIKVVLIVGMSLSVYHYYGFAGLTVFLCSLIACGSISHFTHRWKTRGWTHSWGLWTHEDDSLKSSRRLPRAYYLVFSLSSFLALTTTVIIMNTFFT